VKRWLRALLGVAVMTVAAASPNAADDWMNLATVSMTDAVTPRLSNRYICYTDGKDIACNAPSLYLSTGGLVGINTTNPNAQLDVYGTISATNFVGDGSGLTGITAGAITMQCVRTSHWAIARRHQKCSCLRLPRGRLRRLDPLRRPRSHWRRNQR